jgi:hypothetical protein
VDRRQSAGRQDEELSVSDHCVRPASSVPVIRWPGISIAGFSLQCEDPAIGTMQLPVMQDRHDMPKHWLFPPYRRAESRITKTLSAILPN